MRQVEARRMKGSRRGKEERREGKGAEAKRACGGKKEGSDEKGTIRIREREKERDRAKRQDKEKEKEKKKREGRGKQGDKEREMRER